DNPPSPLLRLPHPDHPSTPQHRQNREADQATQEVFHRIAAFPDHLFPFDPDSLPLLILFRHLLNGFGPRPRRLWSGRRVELILLIADRTRDWVQVVGRHLSIGHERPGLIGGHRSQSPWRTKGGR